MMMYGRKITTRKQESVTKDNMEIVSALKRKVADKVGQQKFELWFTEEIHWAIEDSALVLSSAARFMIERLRRTLAKAIHTAVVQGNLNITDVYYYGVRFACLSYFQYVLQMACHQQNIHLTTPKYIKRLNSNGNLEWLDCRY